MYIKTKIEAFMKGPSEALSDDNSQVSITDQTYNSCCCPVIQYNGYLGHSTILLTMLTVDRQHARELGLRPKKLPARA